MYQKLMCTLGPLLAPLLPQLLSQALVVVVVGGGGRGGGGVGLSVTAAAVVVALSSPLLLLPQLAFIFSTTPVVGPIDCVKLALESYGAEGEGEVPRCARDTPEIRPRYARDAPGIALRYA